MEYAHPLYTPESVAAQARLPEIDTDRIAFAGAYHGWGFHEDGARSGLAAVERLGLTVARCERRASLEASTETPTGIYATTIPHTRRTPFTRRSRTAPTPGWSTSTTSPTTGCSAGSRPATTSVTRTGRSATTSRRSSPTTG